MSEHALFYRDDLSHPEAMAHALLGAATLVHSNRAEDLRLEPIARDLHRIGNALAAGTPVGDCGCDLDAMLATLRLVAVAASGVSREELERAARPLARLLEEKAALTDCVMTEVRS